MARAVYWKRTGDLSFNWSQDTQASWQVMSIPPGETLIRTNVQVRFWANEAQQTGFISPDSLYNPYAFAMFWRDSTFTLPSNVGPLTDAETYAQSWLWWERFTLRDAYTPSGYAGVNIGWIDDRPSMDFVSRARRISDPESEFGDQLWFCWEGFTTLGGDALALAPKCSISCLLMEAPPALP